MRLPFLLVTVVLCACSRPEPQPSSSRSEGRAAEAPAEAEPEAEREAEQPAPVSCEQRLAAARRPIDAVIAKHATCEFDVDCVEAAVQTPCVSRCPQAIHPAGLSPLREALAEAKEDRCPPIAAQGCEAPEPECAEASPHCREGECAMVEGEPELAEVPVPEQNARARADDPPPRPKAGEAEQQRARRLLQAIVRDEPALARDFFFPKEAFRHVKGIADPDRYWKRLFERYEGDIHALHESLSDLDDAEFDRLEIVRRGGWVKPREEANALPYWAARHNRLHYRAGGEERTIEVRVLITWGERWYVTHLSEFH